MLQVLYDVQWYQKRVAHVYNKKIKERGMKEGNLVLNEIWKPTYNLRGKFNSNEGGPLIVKRILSSKAIRLIDLDGNEFKKLINLDQIKKYYA